MYTRVKCYYPFVSPFDPCRPMRIKYYSTPPQLYIQFQPYGLPQYPPKVALKRGTLWPAFYDPYQNPYEHKREDEQS